MQLAQLEAVTALCHQLQPRNASFHQALRSLPPRAAVRLVATWMLTTQGDVLRMAANSVSLASLPRRSTSSHHAIDLTDLSHSASPILSGLVGWLHNGSDGAHTAAHDAPRVQQLTAALTSHFVEAQREAARKSSKRHVTRGLASPKERAQLAEALTTDRVLAPVLRRADSAVYRVRETS